MSERNLYILKERIDDFIINPSRKNACLIDAEYNHLKRTYPQCELAEQYHGRDCQVKLSDTFIVVDARIVRDGIWAAIEFHGAQVTYSWEAVHEVMTDGGVFEI